MRLQTVRDADGQRDDDCGCVQVSSRSHTVFTITIVQRDRSTGQATSAMLHLVDLAGSERLKKSESQGARLREALHINTSLTALGKVVTALDPAASRTHVPYRSAFVGKLLIDGIEALDFAMLSCVCLQRLEAHPPVAKLAWWQLLHHGACHHPPVAAVRGRVHGALRMFVRCPERKLPLC